MKRATRDAALQINSTILGYRWRSAIFRLPLPAHYRDKLEGGLNLTHVRSKSDALFLSHCLEQFARGNTPTTDWFQA